MSILTFWGPIKTLWWTMGKLQTSGTSLQQEHYAAGIWLWPFQLVALLHTPYSLVLTYGIKGCHSSFFLGIECPNSLWNGRINQSYAWCTSATSVWSNLLMFDSSGDTRPGHQGRQRQDSLAPVSIELTILTFIDLPLAVPPVSQK